jgi:hypothetical protein
MMRRIAAVLLLAGGLLYANWLVQLVLPVHLNPFTTYVSELSALSQPYHSVFRTMDVISGLAVASGAALALAISRRGAAAVSGWIAVALFGLSNVMDALTPLQCTITVRTACRAPRDHDVWRWLGDPHLYASLGEEVFFVAAWIAICFALRSSGAPATRRIAVILGAAAVSASIAAGALTADLTFLGHDALLGLPQRVEVLLMAVWIAVVPARMLVPTPLNEEPGTTGPRQASVHRASV